MYVVGGAAVVVVGVGLGVKVLAGGLGFGLGFGLWTTGSFSDGVVTLNWAWTAAAVWLACAVACTVRTVFVRANECAAKNAATHSTAAANTATSRAHSGAARSLDPVRSSMSDNDGTPDPDHWYGQFIPWLTSGTRCPS